MEITLTKKKELLIINFNGRLDGDQLHVFEEETRNIEDINKKIVLNFEKLLYISSAGLRSIIMFGKKINQNGGELLFADLNGMVKEVMEITGFSNIFKTYKNVNEII